MADSVRGCLDVPSGYVHWYLALSGFAKMTPEWLRAEAMCNFLQARFLGSLNPGRKKI
jgi:hypothetical protein